ncbi:hypothetical protein [Leuconostoc litchii]|uniref:hypothetical protein n=1 Tax=Leuconostoc litchii TaxID=1981069 RepID=UPI0024E1367C|nr:hypothetical protein [Leuconostoc litchii]
MIRNSVVLENALIDIIINKKEPITMYQWLTVHQVNIYYFMQLLSIILRAQEKEKFITVKKLTRKWHGKLFGDKTASHKDIDDVRQLLTLMLSSGDKTYSDAARYVLDNNV